jgi:hypothetical protein
MRQETKAARRAALLAAASAARSLLRAAIAEVGGIDAAARAMRVISPNRAIADHRMIIERLLNKEAKNSAWWLASKALGFTLPPALRDALGESPAYGPRPRKGTGIEARTLRNEAMRGASKEERAQAEAERKARWAQVRANAEAKRQAEEARRRANAELIRVAAAARRTLRAVMRDQRLTSSAVISAMCAVDPTRKRAQHAEDVGAILRRCHVRQRAWWTVSRALGFSLPPALAQALGPCPPHLLTPPDLDAIPRRQPPREPPANKHADRIHAAKRAACEVFTRLLSKRGLSPYKLAKRHIKDNAHARSVAATLRAMTISPYTGAPVCSERWHLAARWLGVSLSVLCDDPEWLALQPQEEPDQ